MQTARDDELKGGPQMGRVKVYQWERREEEKADERERTGTGEGTRENMRAP